MFNKDELHLLFTSIDYKLNYINDIVNDLESGRVPYKKEILEIMLKKHNKDIEDLDRLYGKIHEMIQEME